MAYKYITSSRVNSTIKKHGLQIQYTKGEGYFYFTDLKTGDQVGDSIMVARLHHLTIQQWREAAEAARATVPLTPTSGATKEVARKLQEDAAAVRELVESLEDPVEEEEVDPELQPF